MFGVYLLIFWQKVSKPTKATKKKKKKTHFTIQIYSKHPTHFANLNSLNFVKQCSHNMAKGIFLVGVRKGICPTSIQDS